MWALPHCSILVLALIIDPGSRINFGLFSTSDDVSWEFLAPRHGYFGSVSGKAGGFSGEAVLMDGPSGNAVLTARSGSM